MAPTKVSPAGSSKTTKRPRKRPSKTTVKPAPANKKLSMDDLVAAPRVVSGQLVDVWEDDDEPTRGGLIGGLGPGSVAKTPTKHLRKILTRGSTWWTVGFLLLLIGIGVVCVLFAEDANIAGLSVPAWCLLLVSLILLWHVSLLAAKLLSFLICRALRKAGQYRIMYYVNGSVRAIRYLAWSILFFILWTTIYNLNPWQAGDREPDYDVLWWVFRALVVNILCAVYLLGRHAIVMHFRVQRQADQFADDVDKTVDHQRILDVLTEEIPARFLKHDHRGRHYRIVQRLKTRKVSLATQTEAAIIIQRAWRRVILAKKLQKTKSPEMSEGEEERLEHELEELEDLEIDESKIIHPDLHIHNTLEQADHIKKHPLEVCLGIKVIENERNARRLARVLWDKYSGDGSVLYVDREFKRAFKHHKELYPKALGLFDPVGLGKLDFHVLEKHTLEAFNFRQKTSAVLVNADSILGALSAFLTGVVCLFMFITLMIAFSTGPFASVALTIGTTFLALSFIFADSCRKVFNSFVFLFIRDPYDVGDRVHVGNSVPMYVIKLELMTSTFRDFQGQVTTFPNYGLLGKDIVNINRSGPLLDVLDFHIHYETPSSKLDALEKFYRTWLATHTQDFIEPQSKFLYRGLFDTNKLWIQIRPRHTTNWQNGEIHKRRSMIVRAMTDCFKDLGIKYFPPMASVQFSSNAETMDNLSVAMRGVSLSGRMARKS